MIEAIQTSGARVALQGVEGSYGHGAALQFFGREASLYHVTAMEDVMAEVEEGRADYGVLPIENSSAGAVSDNYDLLVKHNNYIVAETQLGRCATRCWDCRRRGWRTWSLSTPIPRL